MNLLAIDTATSQVAVGLGSPDAVAAAIRLSEAQRHAEVLAPAIEALCRLAGIPLHTVARVAVDVGPGLFTGTRVGVATAKALATALRIPVGACSSLDLLAHPHHGRPEGTVVAAVDARRGEVFWAMYRGGREVSPMTVSPPGVLAEAIAGACPPVLAVGDGARRHADVLVASGAELGGPETAHPTAESLVELGWRAAPVAPVDVEPIYLRVPDVRIGWVERAGSER